MSQQTELKLPENFPALMEEIFSKDPVSFIFEKIPTKGELVFFRVRKDHDATIASKNDFWQCSKAGNMYLFHFLRKVSGMFTPSLGGVVIVDNKFDHFQDTPEEFKNSTLWILFLEFLKSFK